ncbi:MAG: tryptophan--tRNA ligase [Chlamydiia bacterium]
MMKKRILTGDRPTGQLHLGHYVGSLKNRLLLQDTHEQFVMIADAQALTDNYDHPERVRANIYEVMLDYLAVGIDPSKTCIFIQSQIPQLFELTFYFLNMVTYNRLKHNPTVKAEMQQKGLEENVTAGFMIYPVSQAADITLFSGEIVPVGADQMPILEQTNEIVRRFNTIYKTSILKEATPLFSNCPRLVGADGKAKMSKSLGNALTFSASFHEIEEVVKKMYTDPDHLRVQDPGKVEGNVVFTYLDAFDPNVDHVAELKAHYQKGGLGDMVIKRHLMQVLEKVIAPIRDKRAHLKENPNHVLELLHEGTKRARIEGARKLAEIKEAMSIHYHI